MRQRPILLLVLMISVLLSACGIYNPYNEDYKNDVTEYAMISQDGDLSVLEEYPNLNYVDLRGSTCYDEILEYAQNHPLITVRYSVSFGNVRFNSDVEKITLGSSDATFEVLMNNLRYLTDIRSLHLTDTGLDANQLSQLTQAYPDIRISYDMAHRNHEFSNTMTDVDLSYISQEDIQDVIFILERLPDLKTVRLSNGYGDSALSAADVKLLVDALPGVQFQYDFTLFGQRLNTLAKELVFDEINIGDEGIDKIYGALDIMKDCSYVLLDSCNISNEVMVRLQEAYPDKEIVWRVFVDRYSLLTDEEMVRMTSKVTDENVAVLKYCTKVKYLDLSLNRLTDISVLSSMPELECVVLSHTSVTDLSPLSGCKNLIWLDLCGCSKLKDLTPLEQMSSLKYLNISQSGVSDISMLDGLSLERFSCTKSKVYKSDINEFAEQHPGCLTVSTGTGVGYGWKYNDREQREPFDYFVKMQEVFRYNEKKYFGNRKES